MTGDYFRIAWTGKIIKIVAVDECSGSVDYFDGDAGGVLTIGVEKIEPIPLTAEILEKNWWKYNPTIKSYEWQGEAFYICINLNEKTRIYVVNDYIFGMALGAVHELQHALRLCEIDKTIEI